jgi:hypothetical protein
MAASLLPDPRRQRERVNRARPFTRGHSLSFDPRRQARASPRSRDHGSQSGRGLRRTTCKSGINAVPCSTSNLQDRGLQVRARRARLPVRPRGATTAGGAAPERAGEGAGEVSERVAVITDIHANLPALETVFARIAELEIETAFCGGDLVGPCPRACRWRMGRRARPSLPPANTAHLAYGSARPTSTPT